MKLISFVSTCVLSLAWAPAHLQAQGCAAPANLPAGPVQVSSDNRNKAEVAISVDPSNPSNQVIVGSRAARTDDHHWVVSYFTCNGGNSWTQVLIPTPSGEQYAKAIAWGDASVAHDHKGAVYVAYNLREGGREDPDRDHPDGFRDAVVVARSTDGGATYTPSVVGRWDDDGKDVSWADEDNDKPFIEVDDNPASPGKGNVYVAWTDFPPGNQGLYLARSRDNGRTWTTIKLKDSVHAFAVDLGIGPAGEVYAVWRNATEIRFLNCGVEATDCEGPHADTLIASTANFNDPEPTLAALGGRDRLLQLPSIDVDRSGGPRRGRIWVAFADFSNTGEVDDIDIFVTWYDSANRTWHDPVKVNRDNTHTPQFHPWLDVDDSDGSVGVVYYSAQNDPESNDPESKRAVDVYYAEFYEGSWTNRRVSTVQSKPTGSRDKAIWYREYIGVHKQATVAYATWVAFVDTKFQVFWARMPRLSLSVADYIVVADEAFTLRAGEHRDFDIRLPNDAVVAKAAILAYVADPSSSADSLEYEVAIYQRWLAERHAIPPLPGQEDHETTVLRSGQFGAGVSRGLWETITGPLLRLDTPPFQVAGHLPRESGSFSQSVRFSVKSGQGSVKFGDVVLWFRRKVAAAPEQ